MAEVIDLEELRRVSTTLRRVHADQSTLPSRVDGLERRLAIIEERQAEVEAAIRALGDDVAQLDRKMDTVTALVRDDVARLETSFVEHRAAMDRRFADMDRKLDTVLAAIAALRPG